MQAQAKSEVSGQKFPPLEPLHFCPLTFAFRPAILPGNFTGRTPKEKHPFLFQKKFHPRQIRNARSVFSFGFSAESARRVAGRSSSVRFRSEPPRAPRVRS